MIPVILLILNNSDVKRLALYPFISHLIVYRQLLDIPSFK
jgi:hypothetical protein